MMHKAIWTLASLATMIPSFAESEELRSRVSSSDDGEAVKLLDTIPSLDTREASLKSFEISGRLPSPTSPTRPMHAYVGWSRNSGSAMLLCTAQSKTPLLWAAENQALICNFTAATMTMVKNVHPQVLFKIVDGEIKYRYRLYSSEVDHLVDLRSFPLGFGPPWSVDCDDRDATLSTTSRSGRSTISLRFWFDPQPRFLSFAVQANDKQRTVLNSVDSVRINKPLSPALLKFPGVLLAHHEIPVVEMPVRKQSNLLSLAKLIHEAVGVAPLLEDAVLREKLASRFTVTDVDWLQSERRFKAVAPKLRQILNQMQDVVEDAGPPDANSRKHSISR